MSRFLKITLALASTAIVSFGAPSYAATVYTNDFQSNANGFTGGQATLATGTGAASGQQYLGPLHNSGTPAAGNSNSATLTLSGNYTGLTLNFDLYAIQSVDGNGPAGGGADPFVILADGVQVFNSNFANYSGDTQGYGGPGMYNGTFAPRTGEAGCNVLGYGCGDFGDALYTLSLALPNGTRNIQFFGNTNEDVGNESYGIDNLTVTGTAVAGVPEPAMWATMFLGFGFLGAAVRRRRMRPGLA